MLSFDTWSMKANEQNSFWVKAENDLRPNYAYMALLEEKIKKIIESDFMCF